jgi:hypothetical protein
LLKVVFAIVLGWLLVRLALFFTGYGVPPTLPEYAIACTILIVSVTGMLILDRAQAKEHRQAYKDMVDERNKDLRPIVKVEDLDPRTNVDEIEWMRLHQDRRDKTVK